MKTEATHTHNNKSFFLKRVFKFYYDGFRSMTVGKTLWAIIGIKLFIFFIILKWIFFPDFLSGKANDEQGKAQYVREQLVDKKQQ